MTENAHNSDTANPAVSLQEGHQMAKGKKGKTRSDAEKSADFKALANKHSLTAIGAVRRLGKLARPGRYSWTPAEVKILETRFAEELGAAFNALKNPPKKGGKMTENLFDAE